MGVTLNIRTVGKVRVKVELSRQHGYLAIYARFRSGKVHETVDLRSGMAADVDQEGRVLGVELIKTFSTKARKIKLEGMIDLRAAQAAVEKRLNVSLHEEFEEIREAASALAG